MIQAALRGDMLLPAAVDLPNKILGRNTKTVSIKDIDKSRPPDLRSEIVKIYHQCDPNQFLIDIVNGNPIPVHTVTEDGEVITVYDTPSLTQRIKCATYLSERFTPKVAVTKHTRVTRNADTGEESVTEGTSIKGFAEIVQRAARQIDE